MALTLSRNAPVSILVARVTDFQVEATGSKTPLIRPPITDVPASCQWTFAPAMAPVKTLFTVSANLTLTKVVSATGVISAWGGFMVKFQAVGLPL